MFGRATGETSKDATMTRKQMKKMMVLGACGGLLFQAAGCVSLLVTNLVQQVAGTLIGGIVTAIIQATRGATGT
jgi:hypothetical protein